MNRRLVGIVALGLFSVSGSFLFARQDFESVRDPRPYLDSKNFELHIALDAKKYAPGTEPVLSATLRNKTRRTIYVMRPLDGSIRGRPPLVQIEVAVPEGSSARELIWFCGNITPIAPGNLIAVPAGESEFLCQYRIHEVSAGPGNYSVQMAYATGGINEGHIAQAIDLEIVGGSISPRTVRKVAKRTPRFLVHSNTVEFDVVEKSAS